MKCDLVYLFAMIDPATHTREPQSNRVLVVRMRTDGPFVSSYNYNIYSRYEAAREPYIIPTSSELREPEN